MTSAVAADDSAGSHARGSSFYAAMRIMPPPQRHAMFEIYAFCRQIDDIADDGGPRAGRMAALDAWRADIDAVYAGAPPPARAGLARAVAAFGLNAADFIAVIDGMAMDVAADIRAPDETTLDLYCDRVASAVGRLSVKVFGLGAEDGVALAHHLGRALQLTNILRDIDEDAAIGRLYLPRERLDAAGITGNDPAAVAAHPALVELGPPLAAVAAAHFAAADAVMARYPRRVVRTPRLMSEAYKVILARLVARGWAAPRQRVRLGKARVLWLVARHAIV